MQRFFLGVASALLLAGIAGASDYNTISPDTMNTALASGQEAIIVDICELQMFAEGHLLGIEKTTRLVTTGAFRYIRHPLYSSLLLLAWGVFFKNPSWAGICLALGATAFLVATAMVEEAENLLYFGPVYREYMRRTKMFIPYLF